MADPRDRIKGELADLVREGEFIRTSERVKTNEEVYAQLKKKLAESGSTAKGKTPKGGPSKAKSAASAKGGAEGRAEIAKAISEESFGTSYQRWYSKALRVVEQILPDRYSEFRELNRLDKRPSLLDVTTYSISEYIHGTTVTRGYLSEPVFDTAAVALTKFKNQIDILASAEGRIESSLADIEGVIEASLLDDEISTARELLRAKYIRAAGVVAGVVLERHLKRLVVNHEITFRKKAQIANLNDALKEEKVYDVPQWRQIQRLGDIRNLCGHDGDRDPTPDEADELISGVEKVSTTVF